MLYLNKNIVKTSEELLHYYIIYIIIYIIILLLYIYINIHNNYIYNFIYTFAFSHNVTLYFKEKVEILLNQETIDTHLTYWHKISICHLVIPLRITW